MEISAMGRRGPLILFENLIMSMVILVTGFSKYNLTGLVVPLLSARGSHGKSPYLPLCGKTPPPQ